MQIPIAKINKDISIVFNRGKFDNWCVFILRHNKRHAPRDSEYFNFFIGLAKQFSADKVYRDFVKIYDKTSGHVDIDVIKLIKRISKHYIGMEEDVCLWFTVLYAGMIAEENKHGAILKKRIKRLGFYTLLIESRGADYSSNFLRGRKWRELDLLCKQYGF